MSRHTKPPKSKQIMVRALLLLVVLGCIYSVMGNSMFFVLPAIILLIIFLPKVLPVLISSIGYHKTEYYHITHKPLFKLWFDKGAYGEYMIYRHLDKKIEGEHQWLFNAYLPRSQNRTTEIDVILFHSSGIYIFESKNYKGWIFGTENHKVWTQCIKPSKDTRVHKYRFLNPIMQNKLHVACMKKFLTEEQASLPIHSIVLFGNRCKLRNIQLSSGKHYVITLNQLPQIFNDIANRTPSYNNFLMQAIYHTLYPMTQVSEEVKKKHIADIEEEIRTHNNTVVSSIEEFIPEEGMEASVTDLPFQTALDNRDATQEPVNAPPSSAPHAKTPTDEPAAETSIAKFDKGETCPRCGAVLVLREVKKGTHQGETFVGCSRFPKCRYTK